MDVQGYFATKAMMTCNRYALVLVDGHTRWTWVGFCRKKSDAIGLLDKARADLTESGRFNIRHIHSDTDSVFVHHIDRVGKNKTQLAFRTWCARHNITQTFSCPYTQSQNGVAERMMLTLLRMVRVMLKKP
jgi:hypothetical protein